MPSSDSSELKLVSPAEYSLRQQRRQLRSQQPNPSEPLFDPLSNPERILRHHRSRLRASSTTLQTPSIPLNLDQIPSIPSNFFERATMSKHSSQRDDQVDRAAEADAARLVELTQLQQRVAQIQREQEEANERWNEELPGAEEKVYKDTCENHFEELMVRMSNIEGTLKQQIENLKREVEEKHAHQVTLLTQQIHQLREQNLVLHSELERERRQPREHVRAIKDKCGGELETIEIGDTVLLYDSVAGCFREKKSGRGYTPYKVTQICAPNRFMLFNGKNEISVTRGEIRRSNGAYSKDVLDPG